MVADGLVKVTRGCLIGIGKATGPQCGPTTIGQFSWNESIHNELYRLKRSRHSIHKMTGRWLLGLRSIPPDTLGKVPRSLKIQ